MKVHLLNGFLGSGKTTAIRQACIELMQQNFKVGVITNDQGIKLVDGDFFKSLGIPNRQVVNGCFCCNYNQFDDNMQSLIETNQPDIIFAESVGSCTDIVATVVKPLQHFNPAFELSFSVFADARLLLMLLKENFSLFDDSVNYIYQKQLEEASIIVINKIDLLQTGELEEIKSMAEKKFPSKKIIYQNSLEPGSIRKWLAVLDQFIFKNAFSLELDYDIYGAGEAKLAWVDQEMTIYSVGKNALQETVDLVRSIYGKIKESGYPIGHLKFLMNEEYKFSFTTVAEPDDLMMKNKPADSANLLINARVQTEPGNVSQIISKSIEEISSRSGCKIIVNSVAAFQPGYPRPTHRIV
jgi:Ni2+-binding GTPase involved in maturation of urease and hydrogenase